MKTFLVPFFTITLFFSVTHAEYFVVTSQKHSKVKLSKKELKDIFMGYKIRWPDGSRVRPVHLVLDNASTKEFLGSVVDMNELQFANYWRIKLFSGRGYPPKEVSSDIEVLNIVASDPDAIGIVSTKPSGNFSTLSSL